MKKRVLLAGALLLTGCQSQTQPVTLPLSQQETLRIEIADERYGEELEKAWREVYPQYPDALEFLSAPASLRQESEADIRWLSDLDALYLREQLAECGVREAYEIPAHLQREELKDVFYPICAKGNLFFYEEEGLQRQGAQEEDLESFEAMREKGIRCYHRREASFLYPFLSAAFPTEAYRNAASYFDEQQLIRVLQAYKGLYHENHFSDDIQKHDLFFEEDTYACGPIYVGDEMLRKSEAYQQQRLHVLPMPSWKNEELHPVCITYGFALNANSEKSELAKCFFALLHSEEGIRALLRSDVEVALLKREDVEELAIYDHTKKEMIKQMNDSQLYKTARIQEKPSLDLYRMLQRSDMISIIQNYVYGTRSAQSAADQIQKEVVSWMLRQ